MLFTATFPMATKTPDQQRLHTIAPGVAVQSDGSGGVQLTFTARDEDVARDRVQALERCLDAPCERLTGARTR